ncbi:hypothetical protein ABEF92_001240 [Exophiala dermatitidis]|uniref:Dipeptidyl-peptidase III n=1 Tax=Exophiala dermatitidis (strain ATCC 34100 / CBS 525.76 / NIH/UT8656) TaxID=858893 RepID=H6BNT1_EXODN|nr:dipeptidyl-peptidase III [Exophiala dermatitidis NIH/UT8656]EHY52266.1 dipeptidyl-peptidase III [Exophiala dermatitidis NIH/UT8656]KAJ4504705.1 hypothetical protein HRR75_007517 [Exophiala dermatitidis]
MQKFVQTSKRLYPFDGSPDVCHQSQKTWINDICPSVDSNLGFVEPYRDPYAVWAEWEVAICVSDLDDTSKLDARIGNPAKFILLPFWALPGDNGGKGPFKPGVFQAPTFTRFKASHLYEACLGGNEPAEREYGKLGTSAEECRTMLVSYFLADNKDILKIFGYGDRSTSTGDEHE